MNLGVKVAVIVLTVGMVSGGSFFAISVYILGDDFAALEKQDAESRLALLQEELDQDEIEMRATMGEFIQIAGIIMASNQTDSDYGNLTAHLLTANQIDAFAFGVNGTIIGQTFNWATLELENSTRPVFAKLANSSLASGSLTDVQYGIIKGDARYLVAGQTMSFGNQSGSLFILREMDADYLQSLAMETGLQPIWVDGAHDGVAVDGDQLRGGLALYSADDEPVGTLEVHMDRDITSNFERTWMVLAGGLILVVVLFGITISILLRVFVLNRVRRAKDSMEQIASDQRWDTPMELGGNDEIARMADQFNFLMAELEHAQAEILAKNESLERYARALSHDLRSPLSTLNLNLHLLAMRDDGEEIPRMQRTVKRLDEQILMILETARQQASGYVDANQTIAGVIEDLESQSIALGATVDVQPLPMVPLAEPKLRSLLQNLLENSMKYHNGSGAHIQVDGGAFDGGSYITIKDDGIGMSPEILATVREEFVGDGYGIGLATCHQIMAEVGEMEIESKEGEGTTFTLWFA